MNKRLKNFMLVLVIALLLAACGGVETAPVLEPAVEDISTAVPSGGTDSEQFSKYIGLVYPPFPADLSQGFSMLIQDSDVYGLSLVTDNVNKMLWLSKITHYDTNRNAYWEVKDVLELSNVEAGLTLLPDGCLLNGVPDSEIFVVERNRAIVLAWRANTTLDRFEVIPTNGIECHSDKWISLE